MSFAAGNEYLATAIQECREGWMQCGIACLAQEGKAATATAAITEDTVKSDLIDTRTEIVKDKGRANVVMCTPEYYGLVLKAAGKDFTPSTNDRIAATGNVGQWLGFTFVEANGDVYKRQALEGISGQTACITTGRTRIYGRNSTRAVVGVLLFICQRWQPGFSCGSPACRRSG